MLVNLNSSAEEKLNFWNKVNSSSICREEWNSWIWRRKNKLTSIEQLKKFIPLSSELEKEVSEVLKYFKMAITPYFITQVGLLYKKGQRKYADVLSKTFLPSLNKITLEKNKKSFDDGIGEEGTTPYPYLFQFYPDRVLLLVTTYCPFYCRYCFRRRKISTKLEEIHQESIFKNDNFKKALHYIKDNSQIREVIISGGEPLSLGDPQLEEFKVYTKGQGKVFLLPQYYLGRVKERHFKNLER